jgi:glycosyltransferase involved in cell wall biosynthesis
MEYLGEFKPINLIDPLVSVCIPAFQHEKYIAQCIESVLSQEADFPFEILIGEDDSTDGTRGICKKYAEEHPDRIRLFLRKSEDKMIRNGKKIGRLNHLGLYGSARGEFLCICDGDDYWVDNSKIQHQMDLMRQYPEASICITNTILDGEIPPITKDIPNQISLKKSSGLKKKLYQGHISNWMMRNKMDSFLKNPAAYKSPGLDNLIYNFYKKQGDVILTPKVTSFYRKNLQGSYKKLSNRETHKKRFITNWYLFIYIHKDPILFLRILGFMAKRYYVNFIK